MNTLKIAKEVFETEAQAIFNLQKNLDSNFEQAINSILETTGKVIISGMGKSGLIGKKISATLSSTGTPSFFLHPAEAYHGDLGVIEKDDILILLSNSGETDEILKILPFLQSQKNITISMTNNENSTLAKNTDYHLNISVQKEACPLQLAPTSSTTATLVMGDALAVTLMKMRNFQDMNFAKFHPGGNLGRRLITKVRDIAKSENLPTCEKSDNIKIVISKISGGKFGLVVILENDKICGIITDGDIRRAMENPTQDFFHIQAKEIMTKNPKTINQNSKLSDAEFLMNQNKINSLLVSENKNLVGIIQLYDLD